jgi:signal transduction histidine kinase
MVEAIADGVVDEEAEVRRYVSLIRREIQHLSHLIDDLFELSQIESGSLQLNLVPLRLDELVRDTVAAYEAEAQGRDVQLQWQATPLVVPADPARVRRVLRNLLDNALRHTPPGGLVRVEVRQGVGAAEVRVRDTGPGVPAAEWERVFERFYRGDRARAREERGEDHAPNAGLGLAIASGLVQAHGGSIRLEDAAPGAAFVFTLPRANGAPSDGPSPGQPPRPSALPGALAPPGGA